MELGIFRDSIASKWGFANDYALQKRIENSIFSARATIIQRSYDSTKIFPVTLIERVTCVDLIQVGTDECACGCGGVKSLRTANPLPNPIIVKDDSYFVFVGRGTTSFSYVPFHQVQDIQYRKFSSRQIFYTFRDNYVYIINANALKEVDFDYVPENIRDFMKFGKCANSNCIDNDYIYIEDTLVEGIEALLETRKPGVETGKEDAEITLNQ